jgi:hypothetical protein
MAKKKSMHFLQTPEIAAKRNAGIRRFHAAAKKAKKKFHGKKGSIPLDLIPEGMTATGRRAGTSQPNTQRIRSGDSAIVNRLIDIIEALVKK